jgi:hypothetical protein
MDNQTVLEFLEVTKVFPKVMTVDRTQSSKYLFFCLVRAYHRHTGFRPLFITYSKAEANAAKAQMEEHSLFDSDCFFVLEGFSQTFVDQLNLPSSTYLVAETDGGLLKAEQYSYRLKRDVLKMLTAQLNVKISLRDLMSLDWSFCREYADYEIFLRKAKIMGWSEKDMERSLKENESASILSLLKRSQFTELFALVEKYGASWMYNHLIEVLAQLIRFKALKAMGYEDDRAAKNLEIGWFRTKELIEGNKLLTYEEITKLVERMVKLDTLLMRRKELGISLYLLNSPIRLTK